jgi:selenide,water dikinase
MHRGGEPIVKDLVLVGGGHSHVAVLKSFGLKPMPGVRLTLVTRDVHTPYSGMLPGVIAGHYAFDDAHIDLRPLARFAGARLVHDEAVGIDTLERKVLSRARPPLPYDVLSVNIGSTPRMDDVPGAASRVVALKPINTFYDRWQALAERALKSPGRLRIGVVGAGAGGIEVLLAIEYRLRGLATERGLPHGDWAFHLVTDGDRILPGYDAPTRRRIERILGERAIHVHTGARVVGAEPGGVRTAGGALIELDEILWATPAGTASWLHDTGLALDDRGFIAVDDTLRSVSHAGVFAAGDVASMAMHPRPKAGVIAVRQGAPLAENLRRALTGRALRRFVPQRSFLTILSAGERYAVASRPPLSVEGPLVWRWKEWIDRRWMRNYRELPEMTRIEAPELAPGLADVQALREISAIAMRCGGCGAKVGSGVLERALGRLEPLRRSDVLVGLDAPDDAAVVEIPPGKVMLQTVDFFRSFIDDPYLFGKVAANHSLGDIYAMGGEPQTALAIAAVPYGVEAKVEDELFQMLSGGLDVLAEAGAALVGGHTSEGAELSLGFAIHGLVGREAILRKGGMRAGDRLILTKPIGTGTLFAADMRGRAKGRWIDAALASMIQSNREAARCLIAHGASACTDVTGFGLLGHLLEMTRASRVDAELDLDALPVLDGAEETIRLGVFSSLQPANLRLRRALRNLEAAAKHARYPLLYDPQTAGGLLASVPGDRTDACLAELTRLGYERAAIVGAVRAETSELEPISLKC